MTFAKSSSFDYVTWPVTNVLAFTTTRNVPSFFENNEKKKAELTQAISKPNEQEQANKFDYFNLGTHVGDNLTNVVNNREKLSEFLPASSSIQWLEQVHGNKVCVVSEYSSTPIVADAAITKQKNIALSIMTADCLPILITNQQGTEIAAIHGGWKPLVKNIIANTLSKMTSHAEQLLVWLGPCIGKQAFEVGSEVKSSFLQQSPLFETAFQLSPLHQYKYLANLHRIAQIQLNQLGVYQISTLEHCTYTQASQYYSYRRDQQTGRMASIICRL